MKLRIAASSLAILFASAPAFAQWTWLNPKPQGHTLHDVEFLDDNTAIAVGEAATILVTHDAGLTWLVNTKVLGMEQALKHITRLNDSTAIAVGGGGLILKTENGGVTWAQQPNGIGATLESIDYQDDVAIAVGNGTILRSTNAGESWEPVPGIPYELNSVDVVSTSVAVAVGRFVFLRSEDGGINWTVSFDLGMTNKVIVAFADALNGVTSWGNAYNFTDDGGLSWEQRYGPDFGSHHNTSSTDIELDGIDALYVSALAGGCDGMMNCFSAGHLLSTTDGAVNWSYEWSARRLHGIARNSAGTLLLVGEGGSIYRWSHTGWEQIGGTQFDELDMSAGMAFHSPTVGIIAGTNAPLGGNTDSIFLRTSNGGETWASKGLYYTFIADVVFTPAVTPTAYAVGRTPSNGTALFKSTDGGATWPALWSSTSVSYLWALEFQSSTHGVAVGEGGGFAVIDADVVTTGAIPDGGTLSDVAFADADIVVAVGGNASPPTTSRIVRSLDGGSTWALVPHAEGSPLAGLDFASPTVGVAVGAGGRIVRTEDGGESWSPVVSPTSQYLSAISFSTGDHGMAVGNSGVVLETVDGGHSWNFVDSPTNIGFRDVKCFSPTHAILASWDLIAIEYKQTPLPTMISSFEGEATRFSVGLRWSVRDEAALRSWRIVRTDEQFHVKTFDNLLANARTFVDNTVGPNARYQYTLIAVDADGTETQSAPIALTTSRAELALLPNTPNPFNPSTTIRYVVPVRERVRIDVFDVSGQSVITLVDREEAAGEYEVLWRGVDADGTQAASGVYFVRIEAGRQSLARKMVLLK